MNYGFSLTGSLKLRYVSIVFAGFMLSFGKGANTGRYRFWLYRNIWRKTKTPIPAR